MVEDLYSRYCVNWEVHECESSDYAAGLLERACWRERLPPTQRHRGEDKAIFAKSTEVYEAAKKQHPERWSKETRDWSPIEVVTLNLESPTLINSQDAA